MFSCRKCNAEFIAPRKGKNLKRCPNCGTKDWKQPSFWQRFRAAARAFKEAQRIYPCNCTLPDGKLKPGTPDPRD